MTLIQRIKNTKNKKSKKNKKNRKNKSDIGLTHLLNEVEKNIKTKRDPDQDQDLTKDIKSTRTQEGKNLKNMSNDPDSKKSKKFKFNL